MSSAFFCLDPRRLVWNLDRIAHKLEAADESDPTVQVLEESTRPERLVEQIDKAMNAEKARNHHDFHLHMPHLKHKDAPPPGSDGR